MAGVEGLPTGKPSLTRRKSINHPLEMAEMRIVLLGKTGSGKSSSGNTILGANTFPVAFSAASVTKHCKKHAEKVDDRMIYLVDTPGLFETALTQAQVELEITKCLNLSSPGPHAFLVVMQLGRFTEEERSAVKRIQVMFGEEAIKHTLLLFTHGDKLDGSIEEYLEDAEDDLRELVRSCGNRYHVINNKEPSNREQVLRLLDKIDAMVTENHGRYYTSELYSDVERRIGEKVESLTAFYEMVMIEKEQALRVKYESQLTALRDKLEQSEQQLETAQNIRQLEGERDRILKEFWRYFNSQKKNCRQEVEVSEMS